MRDLKKIFLLTWCAVLIYGSLLPFHFEVPANFHLISILHYITFPRHISKSDFLANILLFIPFGFYLTSFVKNSVRHLTSSLLFILIVSLNFLFSLLLEISQIFLPDRVSSWSDVLAQLIGGVIGYILFIRYYRYFYTLLNNKLFVGNKIKLLIYAYCLILIVFGILPGDIDISPVYVYHKWKYGLIKIIPFYNESLAIILHNFSSQFILYVPLGLLLVLYYKDNNNKQDLMFNIIFISGAVSFFIELIQLFTNYHITDVGEVIASIMGACFGAFICELKSEKLREYTFILMLSLAIIIYGLYPYKFSFDVVERFENISFVPFSIYFNMPFFLSIESTIHKLLFFSILGFGIPLYNKSFNLRYSYLLAICLSIVISLLLMIGRLFINIRIFDISDIIIAFSGSILGVSIYKKYFYGIHVTNEQAI